MAVATDELADGVVEVVLRITVAHIDREEMGAAILELLEHGFPAVRHQGHVGFVGDLDHAVEGPTTLSRGALAIRQSFSESSVRLCHFPYRSDSQEQDRFPDARPVDKGEWLLHGHVHDRWSQNGRMVNLGVDANDFTPVSKSALAHRLTAGPIGKWRRRCPRRHWIGRCREFAAKPLVELAAPSRTRCRG